MYIYKYTHIYMYIKIYVCICAYIVNITSLHTGDFFGEMYTPHPQPSIKFTEHLDHISQCGTS